MKTIRVLFFGSTTDSLIVLEKLFSHHFSLSPLTIVGVVTQPPRPVGRDKTITPTPVEIWAKEHRITVLSFPSDPTTRNLFADEESVISALESCKADLLISASYGQMIPTKIITNATYGGLNVHPSILPRWRGADPVPWAIYSGDHQTGVSVVTLSTGAFDEGVVMAQKKISITPEDTTDPLRAKLFTLGADLLVDILPDVLTGKHKGTAQDKSGTPYARRLTRADGFEPWESLKKAETDTEEAMRIDRKFRAFTPWPGVWTTVQLTNPTNTTNPTRPPSLRSGVSGQANYEEMRLKILACHLAAPGLILDTVQLEGKNPVPFSQFQQAYTTA